MPSILRHAEHLRLEGERAAVVVVDDDHRRFVGGPQLAGDLLVRVRRDVGFRFGELHGERLIVLVLLAVDDLDRDVLPKMMARELRRMR